MNNYPLRTFRREHVGSGVGGLRRYGVHIVTGKGEFDERRNYRATCRRSLLLTTL